MKKTLVALAVAAVAATSANAAVVYNQDGSKVEVGGSVRLLLEKSTDKRADLKNNGSRLQFKGTQDLGNGLSALGYAELRFDGDIGAKDNSNFGNVETKRLWAGLKQDGVGTLTFGRQLTNGDNIQLSEFSYLYGGNNNLTGSSNKSIKFVSDSFNGFSFGLDYLFGDASKKATNYKNGYGAALYYSTDLAQDMQFNFVGGYTQDRFDTVKTTKTDSWRLAGEFVIDRFTVGYNYGQSRKTDNGVKQKKQTYHLLGARYRYSDVSSIILQWHRESQVKATNTYVAGVDYKLHKNVVTFLEYGLEKTDGKKNQHNVGVGLRVFF